MDVSLKEGDFAYVGVQDNGSSPKLIDEVVELPATHLLHRLQAKLLLKTGINFS